MLRDIAVIRTDQQLSQIVRLGCILRIPRLQLLLQAGASEHTTDDLRQIVAGAKSRALSNLQTHRWGMTIQRMLSGMSCQIDTSFYDERQDRLFVRQQVYSRAAALCRGGRPRIHDVCRAVLQDIAYRTDNENPHCVSTALRSGGGVCQAIAHYLCQLLLRCGYPCVIRTGKVNGVNHAWNQVRVNGSWHKLDLCVSVPADYTDETPQTPQEQYETMTSGLEREVTLLEDTALINGLPSPFYIADRRWVCPTRFVQCFNGAYWLEGDQLILCLGSEIARLPLSTLQETPNRLPYMDVQRFAELLHLQYVDNRLLFTEGL